MVFELLPHFTPEHASPPEKASSQNTTSTTRLHRDCTLDERQSAHSTAHFTARLSTCTDQPSPPGKTSPPERSASPTIFQGYRSPRRDESRPPAVQELLADAEADLLDRPSSTLIVLHRDAVVRLNRAALVPLPEGALKAGDPPIPAAGVRSSSHGTACERSGWRCGQGHTASGHRSPRRGRS